MQASDTLQAGYNGLTEHTEGLSAEAYFDPRHHERELQRICLKGTPSAEHGAES